MARGRDVARKPRASAVKSPRPGAQDEVWPGIVSRRFALLERVHGYAAPVATVASRSFSLRYAREPLGVTFASEHYEPPIVFVTRREPYASLTVHEAIEVLEPEYAKEAPVTPRSAISNDDFAGWIDYYASFAERHARALFEEPEELFAQVATLRERRGR